VMENPTSRTNNELNWLVDIAGMLYWCTRNWQSGSAPVLILSDYLATYFIWWRIFLVFIMQEFYLIWSFISSLEEIGNDWMHITDCFVRCCRKFSHIYGSVF
jgi:hypothetical protein